MHCLLKLSVPLEIYISHFRQFLGRKANEDGGVNSGEEERIHPVQPPQSTDGWETQEQSFYLSDPELHSSFVAMCVEKKSKSCLFLVLSLVQLLKTLFSWVKCIWA